MAESALSISALLRNDDWLTYPGERAAIEEPGPLAALLEVAIAPTPLTSDESIA